MAVMSGQVVINPENLEAAHEVMGEFSRAGFEVGPLVANNFSITAPASHFGVQPENPGTSEAAAAQGVLQAVDPKNPHEDRSRCFPEASRFRSLGQLLAKAQAALGGHDHLLAV